MKKIEILFGPEGEIEIEAFGYHGKGCKEATKFLVQALGEEGDVKQKVEWFMANAEAIQKEKSYGYSPAKLCG